MSSKCCVEFTSSTYDDMCLLTLTPAGGQSITINLFGATTFPLYDTAGDVVGYCIKGMNSSVKVSSSSSIAQATVDYMISVCHGGATTTTTTT